MAAMELDNTAGPATQGMSDGEVGTMFGPHDALLVKQTPRGCLQECLGCEAKSEFWVAPLAWENVQGHTVTKSGLDEPNVMHALEESSCLCRLCWRDGRPFDMVISKGPFDMEGSKVKGNGGALMHYKKPCGFPLYFSIPTNDGSVDCPCCCLLPKVDTHTPSGESLQSQSAYVCDANLLVPKFKYSEHDETVYIVKPETCCGGCCIACNCSGKGCGFIPFYFHDPQTMEPVGGGYDDDGTPQIRKVWGGFKKECCTTADTFAVKFPPDITPERKAGLLGMTFLVDFTVFERQGQK